jgi:hypothetical protein
MPCSAQNVVTAPPEHPPATKRSKDGHEGQQDHFGSSLKSGVSGVTANNVGNVSDIVTQNCHRSPETEHPCLNA